MCGGVPRPMLDVHPRPYVYACVLTLSLIVRLAPLHPFNVTLISLRLPVRAVDKSGIFSVDRRETAVTPFVHCYMHKDR